MSDFLGSADWLGSISDSIPAPDIAANIDWTSPLAVDAGSFDFTGGGGSSWLSDIGRSLGAGGLNALGRVAGGLIGAGGNIIGGNQAAAGANSAALIQAAANAAALDKMLAAEKEARDVLIGRSDRGLAEIDAGMGRYRDTVAPMLTPQPIVIPQHRGMTPQQQIGLEDLRRSGLASLSATGMRGAGRAGIGSLMDQERRYRASVASENDADTRGEMRRATTASNATRQGLASAELQTGGAKANTNILTGNQLASSLQTGGQTAANLTSSSGRASADAARTGGAISGATTLANANLAGDTIGQLGAIFADQRRNSGAGGTWGI